MEVRLTNGATVSRVWSESFNTELVAGFQYEQDAMLFAQARAELDVKHKLAGSFYVVTNHYNGAVNIVRPVAPDVAKAA
jgi:hypothetical protein